MENMVHSKNWVLVSLAALEALRDKGDKGGDGA